MFARSWLVNHFVASAAFHHARDVYNTRESKHTGGRNDHHKTIGHSWAPPWQKNTVLLFFIQQL